MTTTAAELDNLSEEERAALEDEDVGTLADTEAAAKAAENIADTDDDSAPPEAPEQPEPAAIDVDPPALRLAPPALEGADEQLNTLLDSRKAIREQYRNGDISAEDKDRIEDEINDKIADIRAARQNAQFVDNFNQQAAENEYLRTLKSVTADVRATDGIDYDKNPMLRQNWDLKVRALASDPANADKSADWFLREGHRQVVAEVERTAAELGFRRDKPAPKDPVKEALAARRPAETRAKSLAALPAAASDSPSAEFGGLDSLNGDELEMAVARMTPEQQERWARQ
jgi:hypothetical protein